ncbi:MAG TPA: hypothetical protein VMR37_03495 [Rhabdochlamydiaceae bacterium]|jgi:thiol:disulfide interchange protein DsbG|nr:hypothetical protein [Rhabdochlamydiaceae bacterium]
MKLTFLKSFILSALLLSSSSLFSELALQTVLQAWGGYYPTGISAKVYGNLANLQYYEVTSPNPNVPKEKGYVDQSGLYLLFGCTVITSPSEIQAIKNGLTRLNPAFDEYNLQAYVGPREGGGQQIIFIDSNDQYAVAGGSVIDSMNGNTTLNISMAVIPQAWSNFLYSQHKKFAGFRLGKKDAPRTVYVFGEPNCPICNGFYLEMKPYVDAGQLVMYWSLISFNLQATSFEQCYAILDGKTPRGFGYPRNPAGAFSYNEDFYSTVVGLELGAIPGISNPSPAAVSLQNRAQQFFMTYFNSSVPVIIYLNTAGEASNQVGWSSGMGLTFFNTLYVK